MPHRLSHLAGTPGRLRRWLAMAVLLAGSAAGVAQPVQAHSCVWKVSDANGHTLYLAGSVHVLRTSDYPLPAAYDQAFAASSGLAFEVDPAKRWGLGLTALLPRGQHLKDKVDPRTYAYILRVLSNVHGSTAPEMKIDRLRPWALSLTLESPGGLQGVSTHTGVENYLVQKNNAARKRVVGLETVDDHIAVFGKMNDADSEVVLLLAFIHLNTAGKQYERTVASWKRGDIADVEKILAEEYGDAPAGRARMLTERNLRWVPEIDGFLRSGQTWMVTAGTGHMAGSQGLPALLAARGYKVEQL